MMILTVVTDTRHDFRQNDLDYLYCRVSIKKLTNLFVDIYIGACPAHAGGELHYTGSNLWRARD
jgi:hypothetical protein